jgi:hypothetical protein
MFPMSSVILTFPANIPAGDFHRCLLTGRMVALVRPCSVREVGPVPTKGFFINLLYLAVRRR